MSLWKNWPILPFEQVGGPIKCRLMTLLIIKKFYVKARSGSQYILHARNGSVQSVQALVTTFLYVMLR